MDLQKVRLGVIIFAIARVIAVLVLDFNYSDFLWYQNKLSYIGIIACVLLIVSMVFTIINERK